MVRLVAAAAAAVLIVILVVVCYVFVIVFVTNCEKCYSVHLFSARSG